MYASCLFDSCNTFTCNLNVCSLWCHVITRIPFYWQGLPLISSWISNHMSAPSHYLNHCWNIVNLNLRNKREIIDEIHASLFEKMHLNVVCDMVAFMSRPQCVSIYGIILVAFHCSSMKRSGKDFDGISVSWFCYLSISESTTDITPFKVVDLFIIAIKNWWHHPTKIFSIWWYDTIMTYQTARNLYDDRFFLCVGYINSSK